jgi:hypothetical protein
MVFDSGHSVMTPSDNGKHFVQEFFSAIAPLEQAYVHAAFHYVAVKTGDRNALTVGRERSGSQPKERPAPRAASARARERHSRLWNRTKVVGFCMPDPRSATQDCRYSENAIRKLVGPSTPAESAQLAFRRDDDRSGRGAAGGWRAVCEVDRR